MKKHQHCLICNSNNIYPLKGYETSYLNKCKNVVYFSIKIPSDNELESIIIIMEEMIIYHPLQLKDTMNY